MRADEDGPVLTVLDRGALPAFGVQALGVHVNGLVRRAGRRCMSGSASGPPTSWSIRASSITSWPAACAAGHSVAADAGQGSRRGGRASPRALARSARHVARIAYAMDRPEGLRRDVLHCFDLELPEDFVPHPHDGEIEHFELWPIQRAYEAVRDTDDFKFNVNLVLIDLFRRLGMPT